jgi:hypothetical protein
LILKSYKLNYIISEKQNAHKKPATIINESPDPIGDAAKMKRVWDTIN